MRGVLLLIVALLLLVAVFALQNPGVIPVRFLKYSADTSLLAVIVVSFGIGIVVGFLCSIPSSFRNRKKVRSLEAEVSSLRKPPAAPPPPVIP
jgi:uncharacterized integral membrane protein